MSIIPTRPLGSQGLMVSAQGLGCMGMTAFYGTFDRDEQESENLRTIEKGLEQGINFLDTAWIYQVFYVAYAKTCNSLLCSHLGRMAKQIRLMKI